MIRLARVGDVGDGETVILAMEGEVDLATARSVREDLIRYTPNLLKTLILDLTSLDYIDSSGVRMLFDLSRRLRDHGQSLVLVVPETSQPWRALELSGVERIAAVHRTLEEAAAGVRGEAG